MFGDSQDYAAQIERLKAAGCEQIFSDREDWGPVGSKATSPEVAELLKAVGMRSIRKAMPPVP